jgi:tRNA(Ile)-lysidine synthase
LKSPTLPEKAKQTITRYSMLKEGDRVLIALSGGADSVCLAEILIKVRKEYGLKLFSIYIDHGLRPEETPKEIEFAREFSEKREIEFSTEKIDVLSYAKEKKTGKQEAARELRYQVLEKRLREIGGNKIALGHTADDRVETFFMRLIRGSGAKGLTSIPTVRNKIIRPLIEIKREEIEEYLKINGIDFITDPSNLKLDYTRNKFRLKAIPLLKEFNPSLTETVLRTIDLLSDEERYFDNIVLKTLMRLIPKKTDEEIELYLVPLESMDRVILRRVLRKAVELTEGLKSSFDYRHIENIMRLVKEGKPGDRLYFPAKIRAVKKYATILITSRVPEKLSKYELPLPGEIRLKETGLLIRAKILDEPVEVNSKSKILLDANKINLNEPLTIRAREDGDFFHPAGFGRRKKLQDFFVDLKVPRDERDQVPIVLSGNHILWVAGYRADQRFLQGPDTKKFILLEIKGH